jgi:hypothetical protein
MMEEPLSLDKETLGLMKNVEGNSVVNILRLARSDLKIKMHREQKKKHQSTEFPGDEAHFEEV